MAFKWKLEQKKHWEVKGIADCQVALSIEDQALEEAKELKATKTPLRLLKNRCDRLVNIVKWWMTRHWKGLRTSWPK
jgi:hypothetical protein